jgi:radical SAM superfamily enzyme YgiQ (UPF0313 family)
MDIKKISFIEPGAPGLHIFSKFPIPRLGAVLLSTILKEKGYNVKTFIEDLAVPDWSFIKSSDLVCISTVTSTAIKAYRIGKQLKALNIPVIMGGAHPTFLPDESLEYADFVIRGEGEHSLVELLGYMEKGVPALSDIRGLSYRDRDGRNVHNPARKFIEDLDSLPIPDFSLVHNWTPSNTYPVSTSRGCPYDCSFCSVIRMFGRRYRFKCVEASLEELKYAVSVSKATKFIVDDNFTANKARAKEILKGMIAEKIKTRWSAQVRTDVASDPELLRLMADSGCHTLFIGFESVNPRTLEEYNKNQDLEDIISCIKTVRYHGIHIHGMFVIGAETDDVDTIHETVDFAKDLGIDTVQIMILTPLPGTPLFNDMMKNGRLLHTDWSKYDVQHVVFKPRLMSPAALQIETIRAMGRFYSWKYIFRHLAKLEFRYTAVGIFGKRAVDKSLKAFSAYLDDPAFNSG